MSISRMIYIGPYVKTYHKETSSKTYNSCPNVNCTKHKYRSSLI